jgi:MraZ protein
MPLFLSTYANKIDKKGRVSVPASFRSALVGQAFQGIVLFKGTTHSCLEGFDYGTMVELSERLDHFDLFSNQQDDLATAMFGEAVQCPFDSEGRIGLPEELVNFAGLGETVSFVGLGRKFQIWDQVKYNERRNAARQNVIKQGLTLPRLKGDGTHG